MSVIITDKSKQAFTDAAQKLGIPAQLPDVSFMRNDHGLYMTAVYMLMIIIEADKSGQVIDITDHSQRKYENIFYAKNGHVPGSSGGGFSFFACVYDSDYSIVGARLSFNSREDGKRIANEYPDLWEIFILNVK